MAPHGYRSMAGGNGKRIVAKSKELVHSCQEFAPDREPTVTPELIILALAIIVYPRAGSGRAFLNTCTSPLNPNEP